MFVDINSEACHRMKPWITAEADPEIFFPLTIKELGGLILLSMPNLESASLTTEMF
jgi:hypothetical protein